MTEFHVKMSMVIIGSISVETDKFQEIGGLTVFQVTDRKSCIDIVNQIANDDVVFIIADGREVYYAEKFFSSLPALKIFLVTEAQAAENKNLSDAIIQLPAQNFNQTIYEMARAFNDFMNIEGLVALDFADIKSLLKNSGKAVAIIGEGASAEEAVSNALENIDIKSARAILMNVKATTDSASLKDIHEVTLKIKAMANESAEILWGVTIDESFGDKVKVMMLAGKFA